MPTLVSTGQITIIDSNDARPITAVLAANQGTQQVYTKDEATVAYTPSWVTTPLVITPQISVGGLTAAQTWARLTNKTFALTAGGTAVVTGTSSTSFADNSDATIANPFTVSHAANGSTTASTFTITGNLKDSVGSFTLFFDADYTDATTGLATHITCQITLTTVKTGTNAVFVSIRGQTAILESDSATKNKIAVAADLIRAGGVDNTGVTYKWYESGGSTQITTSLSGYAGKYGLSNTTAGSVPAVGTLGANIPASGTGNAFNTLTIDETAISDIGVYKVDITDDASKTYSAYFTVYDITDPYDTQILSSSGDKLANGQGSTTLTPRVFNGSSEVNPLTGWTFTWYFYDRNGKRGGFIDTAKISTAGGAPITANTTGTSATITYSGTSYAFVAGDIIKAVKPNGDAFFYEVASSTTNVVTIRTPSTNAWLTFTDFPAPASTADFVSGKLYGCTSGGIRSTSAATAITLTGDEVDSKARILCESTRP